MTLAELRIAYNEACRNPSELERFTLDVMPKVFWLLSVIDGWDKGQSLPHVIVSAARECRPAPKAPKKNQPERYTGGR